MRKSDLNTVLVLLLALVVVVGAWSYHEHEKNTSSLRIGDTEISVTDHSK